MGSNEPVKPILVRALRYLPSFLFLKLICFVRTVHVLSIKIHSLDTEPMQ